MSTGIGLPLLENGMPDWNANGRYINVTVYKRYDSILK
jgi:hypothetical protein